EGVYGSRNEIVNTSVCHLPQEIGKCLAYVPRWAFDPANGRCVQFIYGGCGGNENNFKTKEDCEERCRAAIPSAKPADENDTLDPICRLPQEVGPCQALIPRWAYDASQRRCIEFSYGGCRGNANNFNSKEACEAKCGANSCLRYSVLTGRYYLIK
ncbi:unnamed protein product, partial [Hymenolepis diminuta]|uniref:BPTI/Kunitz inhibitor domain-containing protein n=1 Tax=Hymenolepis diminuta TaxID=6216 RepID=A0A0R3SNH6_HYMDI